MNWDSILNVAVIAFVTGASNAFGIWVVSKGILRKLERKKDPGDRKEG